MRGIMRSVAAIVLPLTIFVLASKATAGSTVVLDQDFFPAAPINVTGGLSNGTTFGRSQTFTVGIDGILDSVEIEVRANEPPTFLRILAATGGTPIGGAAGSVVLASSSSFTSAPRGGPRFSDRLLRWSPDPTGGIWNATKETELPG